MSEKLWAFKHKYITLSEKEKLILTFKESAITENSCLCFLAASENGISLSFTLNMNQLEELKLFLDDIL